MVYFPYIQILMNAAPIEITVSSCAQTLKAASHAAVGQGIDLTTMVERAVVSFK